jgi:two-component system sensor histidine kinase NreB
MAEPLKILLLEDSSTDAEIIQRLLKKENREYEFRLVMSQKDFILELDRFRPGIILSDNSLPQFNATEALKIVRQHSLTIPFILVTGTVSDEFAANIIKSGADDYILKDRLVRLPAAIDAALKQRKAEKEVADYKYALDQSSIISITDQKGMIKYANDNFCKISKYSTEELIGQDHRIINSGYHPKPYIKNLWETIANGNIWRGEFRNKAKDGSIYWVEATIVPFLNEKSKPYQYLAIRADITERKKTEETLQAMEQEILNQKVQEQKKITRAVIKAQERERNYIGQELHDNVNQILAGAKMYLSMAGKNKPETKELIKYPIELIDSCINEIRMLSSRQVTPLKDIHLMELLQSLLDDLKNTTIKTSFFYKLSDQSIDDDLKLNIYRIIQEQANNIVKHADAANVIISVEADEKIINIIVMDDGKGFDVNQKRKGIGISNMINRIESFNGEMSIETSPGNGCKIKIKIPY